MNTNPKKIKLDKVSPILIALPLKLLTKTFVIGTDITINANKYW